MGELRFKSKHGLPQNPNLSTTPLSKGRLVLELLLYSAIIYTITSKAALSAKRADTRKRRKLWLRI